MSKNYPLLPLSGISNTKIIFVMKMVIMQIIEVIDMDSTILMTNGTKMKLSTS